MTRGGPTGKWESLPAHLAPEAAADLRKSEPKLTVKRPGVPAVDIAIDKTEFVIGRLATEVDLTLDDETVSKRHAKLTMDERGYFKLEDLGSQNGIKFEGRPVRRLNLVSGDRFFIGRTEFLFQANMSRTTAPLDVAAKAKRPSSAPERNESRIDIPEPGPPRFEDPADQPAGDE